MNKLDKIQQEHKEWAQKNFPDAPAWHSLLGIGEEVGELMHAFLKQEQGIRGTHQEHEDAKKDAIGDIIIYMLHFCNYHNWSLLDIIDETWEEVKQRDWTKNKENGETK